MTVTGQSCPRPVRTVNQEQSVRVSLIKLILSHYSCVNAKCDIVQYGLVICQKLGVLSCHLMFAGYKG